MKTIKILSLIALSILFQQCSSDDDSYTGSGHEISQTFETIAPADQSTDNDRTITFSWKESANSSNNNLLYDVYLGTDQNNLQVIANDITALTYNYSQKLSLKTTYFWKVVAKHSNGQIIEETPIAQFETRDISLGTLMNGNCFGVTGDQFYSAVFQNKLYMGSSSLGLYQSTSGVNWTQVTVNDITAVQKIQTELIEFNNELWMVTGQSYNDWNTDIYKSSDGINWNVVTTNMPNIIKRQGHKCVVFNNKLWIIGGYNWDASGNPNSTNDVLSSSDGVNWNLVSANSTNLFDPVQWHECFVFNNKIWLIGGSGVYGSQTGKKIWNSSDGVNWNLVNNNPPFSNRVGHKIVEFEGTLYMFGNVGQGNQVNDIWKSNDGINWTLVSNQPNFPNFIYYQAQVFNDKIILVGHKDFNNSEVWYLD